MKKLLSLALISALILTPFADSAAKTKALAPPQPVAEAPAIPAIPALVTSYDVYVGGLHLLSADILFQEENKTYHAQVSGRTVGFWAKALPWHTVLDSQGTIQGDHFVPTEYYTEDVWSNKPRVTKLHFKPDGDIAAEFVPPHPDDRQNGVPDDQRRGALDPTTALLQLLAHVAVHGSCNTTVPVFEGKRRFDITGHDMGTDEIDAEDYGIFRGYARACDAEFNLIAGAFKDRERSRFWQKNDKGDAGRAPFHVWLARVAPNLPELPVRLESESVLGLIVMHLTGWHYVEKPTK